MKYLGAITDDKDLVTKEYVDTADATKQDAIGSTTATLAVNSWSSSTQTVSVTGVTSSNNVIVAPAPASISDYTTAGIYCSAQGSGTLTFTCDTVPTSAITVNVMIVG